MAPETGKPQPLVMSWNAPGGHGNVDPARVVSANDLECRQQIIVREQHHTDVVIALDCQFHEINH